MQTCLPNIQEEKNSQPAGEALPKQTDGRTNRPHSFTPLTLSASAPRTKVSCDYPGTGELQGVALDRQIFHTFFSEDTEIVMFPDWSQCHQHPEKGFLVLAASTLLSLPLYLDLESLLRLIDTLENHFLK